MPLVMLEYQFVFTCNLMRIPYRICRHKTQVIYIADLTLNKQLQNNYRQIYNIRRTKSRTLNVSCLVLQLSLPNPLKPGIESRMKM